MGANATLIQSAYDAFGRGDIPAVIAMLDGNVEWTSPSILPQGGEYSGPAQVGKFFETIGASWETLGLTVESVEEAGSNVIGIARGAGTLKDGTPKSYNLVHVFEVENGKIRRMREYVSDAG